MFSGAPSLVVRLVGSISARRNRRSDQVKKGTGCFKNVVTDKGDKGFPFCKGCGLIFKGGTKLTTSSDTLSIFSTVIFYIIFFIFPTGTKVSEMTLGSIKRPVEGL